MPQPGPADSFYEYLLKQYLLSGRTDQAAHRLYKHAVEGLRSKLLQRSQPGAYLFVAQLKVCPPPPSGSRQGRESLEELMVGIMVCLEILKKPTGVLFGGGQFYSVGMC